MGSETNLIDRVAGREYEYDCAVTPGDTLTVEAGTEAAVWITVREGDETAMVGLSRADALHLATVLNAYVLKTLEDME